MAKIKVLIIDDSALVRKLLTDILSGDSSIEVVGTAPDPMIARDKINKLKPDVLTLDIEMPKMDGLTFLKNIMRLHPMPVVMVSTLTEKGADVTLDALAYGAIDFIPKPKIDISKAIEDYRDDLIAKVKMAARTKMKVQDSTSPNKSEPVPKLEVTAKNSADVILAKGTKHRFKKTDCFIAIGASTGGTEAIKEVLAGLPANSPGIVITQHIPAAFSAPFAKRMDSISELKVKEAEDGDTILAGHAFIAPGDKHLMVVREGSKYICKLNDGPRVNRHKPSVDILFRSVAKCAGQNAIGVILTGMGDDGAVGLTEMHDEGSNTIAQDEKTSVVWGMPGEAVAKGGVDHVLPLNQVSGKLMLLVMKQS